MESNILTKKIKIYLCKSFSFFSIPGERDDETFNSTHQHKKLLLGGHTVAVSRVIE